jgi:hypothetical protein
LIFQKNSLVLGQFGVVWNNWQFGIVGSMFPGNCKKFTSYKPGGSAAFWLYCCIPTARSINFPNTPQLPYLNYQYIIFKFPDLLAHALERFPILDT